MNVRIQTTHPGKFTRQLDVYSTSPGRVEIDLVVEGKVVPNEKPAENRATSAEKSLP
jgi:hypothetical protein